MNTRTGSTARPRAGKIPVLAWHEARPAPVVLIAGSEPLLADRAVAQVRSALRDVDPALEVTELSASDYQPGALATYASPSLFAEPRLIVVSDVEKCTDAFLDEVIELLSSGAADTTLALRHGGGNRGKRLLDAIRGGLGDGIEITAAPLKRDQDRSEFAATEFRRLERRITPGALRLLVGSFPDNLGELAAICAQLVADTEGEISEQVVERAVGPQLHTSAFTVVDTAIEGRLGAALVLLRQAMATGAEPVPIVAAFAMKLRLMAKVYAIRGSGASLASRLGAQGWQIDRARRDVSGWSEDELSHAIEAIAAADHAVKGASRDSGYAVERLTRLIATRGH